MLVRFLARRVAVMAAAASAAALVLDGFSPLVSLGILLGAFLAVYRTRQTGMALAGAVAGARPARGMVAQLMSQLLVLAVLAVTAYANWRLFAGVTGGLLLLPLFICVNAVTERAGLTHNAWGEVQAPGRPAAPREVD